MPRDFRPYLRAAQFLPAAALGLFLPYLLALPPAGRWLPLYLPLLALAAGLTAAAWIRTPELFLPQLLFALLVLFHPLTRLQARLLPFYFPGALFALPLAAYLALAAVARRAAARAAADRDSVRPAAARSRAPGLPWLRAGRFDGACLLLTAAVILFGAAALVLWVRLLRPDLSLFLGWMPRLSPLPAALAALGFASTNSFAEEALYRGALYEGLRAFLPAPLPAILIQAALFGLWHVQGFPGGGVGAGLVFVWGAALGIIRERSGGILGPLVAHCFADLTIFAVLYALARRG